MLKKWFLIILFSFEEVVCIFVVDFFVVCKVDGDMFNYYCWNQVFGDFKCYVWMIKLLFMCNIGTVIFLM